MIPIKVGGLSLTAGPWDAGTFDGWLDSPGAQVPSTPRLRHGDVAGVSRWAGRTVKIEGLLRTRDCDQQQAERDRLIGLFDDGQSQLVEVTHGGVATSGVFQVIDRVDFYPITPTVAEWTLSLYSEEPWLYGPDQITYLFPVGTGVGYEYPPHGRVTDPAGQRVLAYGTATTSQDPVANIGNAAAWPVYVVVGDFPSGFRLRVGDRSVVWPHTTVPQSPVEIDMAGTIRVGGMDQTHRATRREWAPIPPATTIHPVFDPIQPGSGWCEVHHRPTYV